MKPYILFLIVVCSSLSPIRLSSQTPKENLLKYWYYRDRLKYFVVPGEKQGEGDMAGIRNSMTWSMPDFYNLDFGQNGVYTGYYLGILATEYRILKDNGYDDDALNTEHELVYALRQYFNYLDRCEHWWGLTAIDDGYFIRTAVSNMFNNLTDPDGVTSGNNWFYPNEQKHQTILNYKLDSENNQWNSTISSFNDLPRGHPGPIGKDISGAVINAVQWGNPGFPEWFSEDEAIGLLMGFALIYRCMSDASLILTETGNNAKYSAQDFALKIIEKICNNHEWEIYNHPNPALASDQENTSDFAYGYAAAGFWFSDGSIPTVHYFQDGWYECQARGYWNLADEVPQPIYNSVMMCTLAAIGSSWHSQVFFPPFCPSIQNNITESVIYSKMQSIGIHTFYVLLFKVLHPDIVISDMVYPPSIVQLNGAPNEGPYKYGDYIYSGNGWAYTYKWRGTPGEQNTGGFAQGNFSGCDYMLFYNLYLLATSSVSSDYHYYSRCSISGNWPVLEEDNTTICGNNTNILHRTAFNHLSSDARILNSTRYDYQQIPLLVPIEDQPGNAVFLSEVEVKMNAGFYCEKGASFQASICPHVIWDIFSNNNLLMDNMIQIEDYYQLTDNEFNKFIHLNNDIKKQYGNNSKSGENSGINNENESIQEKLKTFPNPVQNYVTILIPDHFLLFNSHLCIINSLGRIVFETFISSNSVSLNVDYLKPGIYSIRLTSDKSVLLSKMVKL